MLGVVEEAIAAELSSIFTIRDIVPCSEWADTNVFLDEKQTSRPGPYNSSFTPFWKDLMDFPRQGKFDTLGIKKSSRVGATEAALNLIRWAPEQHPGNILMAMDSQREMKEVNEVRLKPYLIDRYGGDLIADKRDAGALAIKLSNMTIYLGGGGAEGLFENKWARLVILDEAGLHELNSDPSSKATSVKLGLQRIKDCPDGKMIVMGKPGERGGIIDLEYRRGTQDGFNVPCMKCGMLDTIEFSRLDFGGKDTTGDWDLSRVESETRLKCNHCDHLANWEDDLKPMVNASEAKWISRNEKAVPRHRSMEISDLYSQDEKCRWGIIASEFLTAKQEGSASIFTFYTGRLGRTAPAKAMDVTDETLLNARSGLRDPKTGTTVGPAYELGWVPERRYCPVRASEVSYITWCWDVQDKSYKGVCKAVCHNGRKFLIDYAEVLSEEDVIASYFKQYPQGLNCEETGEAVAGFIDSGDGFVTKEIYELCTHLQELGKFVFPSKGGKATSGKLFAERQIRQFGEGVRFDYWDEALTFDLLKRLGSRKEPRTLLPMDIMEHTGLAAELSAVKVIWVKKRRGITVREIDDRKIHDYWDAFKLCDLTSSVMGAEESGEDDDPGGEEDPA